MSIKKSLRLSIILLSSLPLIFMTVLTYVLSYSKYLQLAKSSASSLAENYAEGFKEQIKVQIGEIESLSTSSSIQSITLESYNGVASKEASPYYDSVKELLVNTAKHMNNNIVYHLYDVNGYFIVSSDEVSSGDWSEYMSTPVNEITETTILKSPNINKETNSIELITPIKFKDQIIGLIRATIYSEYFGAFLPDNKTAFILSDDGDILFYSESTINKSIYKEALGILEKDNENGYLCESERSVKGIYGYNKISEIYDSETGDWLYVIMPSSSEYQKVLNTLPVSFILTMTIILIISIYISSIFAHKYTAPIITLKNNMSEAAAGNLNVLCDIDSNDEFGELSDKFNTMMSIISTNYDEINDAKKTLESNELALKKSYAHIEQLAYHDGLTGLYNRVAFMKYAYEIFQNDGLALNKHAIFFIDLDNFKNVNDTLGHDYGDMLLVQVSNQLSSLISEDDILARTGGDEFLIFKSSYESKESLASFAGHLVEIVNKPFDLQGEIAHVSMSVGIAMFPRDGLTINELIKNADIAMYNAKTSGKNAFKFFNSYMEDDFNRKNDLADILSTVIDKKEVYLMYQPQVSVLTGKVTGYEALMRIESEIVGYIPPTEFIPIAEDSGVINQLGEWALYEACSFNQNLMQSGFGEYKVSVNVSTTQLQDDRLIDIVKSIPERTGMDLKYLEIEITESVLMNSFEHNLELINAMKNLGVSIALDDFGTGYSSFNYLTQIPIDTLKIDKSFIDGICNNEKDKCIADSIISLAHKMNISVVAEGVEDKAQLSILRAQFCDTLQGYLFSKPLKSTELIELLDDIKRR